MLLQPCITFQVGQGHAPRGASIPTSTLGIHTNIGAKLMLRPSTLITGDLWKSSPVLADIDFGYFWTLVPHLA